MAQRNLCLENLGMLAEGEAQAIIDHELGRAVVDVDDRGEDGKERKVVITVIMKRRDDGLVETNVSAKAALPSRRTHSTVTKPVHRDGKTGLMFQEWASDNPDQRTLPPLDEPERKERT